MIAFVFKWMLDPNSDPCLPNNLALSLGPQWFCNQGTNHQDLRAIAFPPNTISLEFSFQHMLSLAGDTGEA